MKVEGWSLESFFDLFGPAVSFHWRATREVEHLVSLAHPSTLLLLVTAARRCSLCASRRSAPHARRRVVSLAHFVRICGASLLRFLRRRRPIMRVSFACNGLGRWSADAYPRPLQRTLVRAWRHVVESIDIGAQCDVLGDVEGVVGSSVRRSGCDDYWRG